jgi:ribosome-associated protein
MASQQQTLELINHVLDEMQAQNVLQLDVKDKTSITDYMFICTGRSSRHVIAIADELFAQLKKSGLEFLRISGTEHGEWALIDCGDILVHIMQPETRAFYNLEELWMNFSNKV